MNANDTQWIDDLAAETVQNLNLTTRHLVPLDLGRRERGVLLDLSSMGGVREISRMVRNLTADQREILAQSADSGNTAGMHKAFDTLYIDPQNTLPGQLARLGAEVGLVWAIHRHLTVLKNNEAEVANS